MKEFLKRKNIVFSARRYGIDVLSAMAQGLFCSLLIGTIVKTLGQQLGIPFLVEVGGYCSAMSGGHRYGDFLRGRIRGMGDRSAALLDGHFRICGCGHGADLMGASVEAMLRRFCMFWMNSRN